MDNPLDLSYLFSILNFEVSMFCSDVLNLLQIFFLKISNKNDAFNVWNRKVAGLSREWAISIRHLIPGYSWEHCTCNTVYTKLSYINISDMYHDKRLHTLYTKIDLTHTLVHPQLYSQGSFAATFFILFSHQPICSSWHIQLHFTLRKRVRKTSGSSELEQLR